MGSKTCKMNLRVLAKNNRWSRNKISLSKLKKNFGEKFSGKKYNQKYKC